MLRRREALILLNMIPGFGMKKYEQLLQSFAGVELVFEAGRRTLEEKRLSRFLIERILKLQAVNPQDELEKSRKAGVKIVTYLDEDYPLALRQIFSPPLVLYIKGEYIAEDQLALAIVGSRKPSIYGRMTAEKLSGELVRRNITVVSGLARGIDTCAHRGALKGKGRTIAVLGSGLGRLYPPENEKLAGEISENGLVVSEFPYDCPPSPANFPRRNRLVSGFSLGIVVVEAAKKSGALITANFGLEQGREIFAVPGKINSPTSAGTHRLIKDGAKIVSKVEDILEELNIEDDINKLLLKV